MSTNPLRLLSLLILLALAGCDTYDFRVNDTVVYTPAALFRDYEVADPALAACLEQAIVDNKISTALGLETLNCSHAGITSLLGLETFTGLTQLKLSSNDILNIVPLERLTALRELHLNSNKIVDPVPLYELPALEQLNLSGNPGLQCPAPGALVVVTTLKLPRHCRS